MCTKLKIIFIAFCYLLPHGSGTEQNYCIVLNSNCHFVHVYLVASSYAVYFLPIT